MAASILIVDDDPVQRRLLEAAVLKFGHLVVVTDGGEAALKRMEEPAGSGIDVVILDLAMPGVGGMEVLQRMRERGNATPTIVQTAQGGIETVVAAMRHGAFDFVVKPTSPERLRTAIANALKVEALGEAIKRSGPLAPSALGFRDMVTQSPTMARVIRLAQKAAASNIPILIEGESGVGKELVARAIQSASERRSRPFITVNCGAIPDNLVESILFGHEKGSFTGATEKHAGKFVEAHTGTLFLDEVGDLPRDVQVKLLRAVQDGDIDPVGGRATMRVDIRLISATHRNLAERVAEGRFREDLFYRLNVFPIVVPPLRDRREDIPHLVRHFITGYAAAARGRTLAISPQALALLQAYDWPGNIRQLENAVFRATVLCEGATLTSDEFPQIRAQVEGVLRVEGDTPGSSQEFSLPDPWKEGSISYEADALPSALPEPPGFGFLRPLDGCGEVRPLAEIEAEMIAFAIRHYNGRMSEVARRLGIGRSTLYRKLKEYGLEADGYSEEAIAS